MCENAKIVAIRKYGITRILGIRMSVRRVLSSDGCKIRLLGAHIDIHNFTTGVREMV